MSPTPPELVDIGKALSRFAFPSSNVQTSEHIRRFHWYAACRLVIEGGFNPDYICPRPPLRVEKRGGQLVLHHDPSASKAGERTVLGGLKTKMLDVTVSIPGVGPVVAISLKGTHNAIRNLTNRMEEAAGDCTNLHMAYPALVYGFWHVIRANDEDDITPVAHFKLDDGRYKSADLTVVSGGALSEGVARYAHAIERLSDRDDLRDHPSRYEACGLTLVNCAGGPEHCGVHSSSPAQGTVLDFNRMFQRLYMIYDRRFVYSAPALKSQTSRAVWDRDSSLLVNTILSGGAFSEMDPRML